MVDVRIALAVVVVVVIAIAVYAYIKSQPDADPKTKYADGTPTACKTDAQCAPGTCGTDGLCVDTALSTFTAQVAKSADALRTGVETISSALDDIETGAKEYVNPSLRYRGNYVELWNTSQYPAIDAAKAALDTAITAAKTLTTGYLNQHEVMFTNADNMSSYLYLASSGATAYESLATIAASDAPKLADAVSAVCKATIALLTSTYYVTLTGQKNGAPLAAAAHDKINGALMKIAGPGEKIATEGKNWSTILVAGTSTLDVVALAKAVVDDAGTLVAHFN
jgi:hypothetical protein